MSEHFATATSAALPDPKPTVLMLHGSMSHGGMWKRLRERLEPKFQVLAPDLIGYGSHTDWSPQTGVSLADEVMRLERLVTAPQLHLVGYSYGGAVALALARRHAERILSLTLIEPVAFPALLLAGECEAYAEFQRWYANFATLCAGDARAQAMRQFLNAWSGEGSWEALPTARRDELAAIAEKIIWDWQASFDGELAIDVLASLGNRITLMCGDRSPHPMRVLVRALSRLAPASRLIMVAGANHLLPLTHPEQVQLTLCEPASARPSVL